MAPRPSTSTIPSSPSRTTDPALILGPMLRHVDATSATIWVETRDAAEVIVRSGQDEWSARTFAAHGHHYALVGIDGLAPGSVRAYTVDVNGERVWPNGSGFPPSSIATLDPGRPLRLAFGSCRTSVPHDPGGNRTHGVDSLRAFALHLAADPRAPRPDLALFLGDQVYADSTSSQMRDFIASRRSLREPPGKELKDYEEYAHLYRLAWSDPANRWLLSTLPTAMLFDDHDLRDDWNASLSWKRKMEATGWWQDRVVAGLGTYWVYQHLGNLSPAARAEDPLWQMVAAHDGPGELDLTGELDAFADHADKEPASYHWSYRYDIGDVRLVMLDTRASRQLEPEQRGLLDAAAMQWLDGQLRGGVRHLLIGSSLPFLLPTGLHNLEAWNEALCNGRWGRGPAVAGEWLRQTFDLEHWAAFERSFQRVASMVVELASGQRGPAPETVTFLSGDVHYSYVAEVEREDAAGGGQAAGASGEGAGSTEGAPSRILQAVCSPVRNPLPRWLRFFSALMSYGPAAAVGARLAHSAKVPDPPFAWHKVKGPWFDNNLAVLEEVPDGLLVKWHTGVVDEGRHWQPRLETVAELVLGAPRSPRSPRHSVAGKRARR
ncbi:metallophosphatase [Zafaria cholistanensis]|uniref:Metallophosphatase n=1 Tax=Zafaria cholistanensis TaxID=1682741 RepID=A0A5A7NPN4_9MICC|nr:alkaline phosphatase D family protein [Zafaria cholistanensis]GER22760.1 metallophosphatase [Zafaria cholistanensis]